jgi:hypothetical protein
MRAILSVSFSPPPTMRPLLRLPTGPNIAADVNLIADF